MAQIICPLVAAEDRARLEAIVGDRNRAQEHAARARIILVSADRLSVAEVARLPGSVARRCGAGSDGSPRLGSRACCGMPPASRARRPWAMWWSVGW
jgi:hypothetical protein